MAKQEEGSFDSYYRTTRGDRDVPDVGDVYYDDRMHVLHVVKCTATLVDDDHIDTNIYYEQAPSDHSWCVVTYRNTAGYPVLWVDHFDSDEAAHTFMQTTKPRVPRISLGGRSPRQPLPYEQWLSWKSTNRIVEFDFKVLFRPGGFNAREYIKTLRRPGQSVHADGWFKLGFIYDMGHGVPQDYAEAARLYRQAAEQGHYVAQHNLGLMYANGTGLPEHIVLAYMWWNLAVAQGYESAQHNKDIAESRMTREQIAEAEQLSREWIAAHPPGGN